MSTISKILAQPPDQFSTQIASSTVSASDLSVSLDSTSGLPTEGIGQFFKKDSNGDIVSGSIEFVHWTNVSGNTLTFSDTGDRGITGSDSGAQSYVADDYFEVWASSYYTAYGGLVEHNGDGTHGAITATSIDLGSSTVVSSVLDEDTLSSDSATALATQQSIKAYADSLARKGMFGTVVGVGSLSANQTLYCSPVNLNQTNATETSADTLVPAMTLLAFGVHCPTNSVDGTTTITVRDDAADTALAVSFTSSETGTKTDTGSVSVASGSLLSIKIALGGSTGSFQNASGYLVYQLT